MATNVSEIVYLNIDHIQYCNETYQIWMNRQTMQNGIVWTDKSIWYGN